jgi:tetratricopeptide (TPR) repeat protein
MRFRILRGYSIEARNNVRAALVLPGIREPNVARGHALYVGGVLATNQSDYAEASKMLSECLGIRRGLENPRETAAALSTLATLHLQQDDLAQARDYVEEAIGIFRDLGDRIGEAIGLLNLGDISVRQADFGGAQDLFEQCLVISRSIKHQELESDCERNLGELALSAGNLRVAQARFARSLEICQGGEDKRGGAIALWSLGRVDAANGNHTAARRKFAEALPAFQGFGMISEALDCLEEYAVLLHALGRSDGAVQLHAAAASIRAAFALPRSRRDEPKRQANIDAARAAIGDTAFDAAWSEGQTWALARAIERALAPTNPSAVTT